MDLLQGSTGCVLAKNIFFPFPHFSHNYWDPELKPPEIILHPNSFDPAVLVFVVHIVSTKKYSDATQAEYYFSSFLAQN